jgi:hypothetical protein
MEENEDYAEKAQNIFNLINKFRANPRELARHLQQLKKYLDTNSNILSEPDKIQIQMVEGEEVFNEAINYLNNLRPMQPFQWEEALAQSAQEHVDDIGPKGLLLYQSSDGTEPEDRIAKYGDYVESLGENIDFGPNDALGVIVSLTLDDGEEERPHRENLFKAEYKKIGIACGPHQTEFQMCVMDLAYDFIPKGQEQEHEPEPEQENINNNYNKNKNLLRNNDVETRGKLMENNQTGMGKNLNNNEGNEIDFLTNQVKVINSNKKIVKREVEIITKITYTYEDGSKKEINEVKKHNFDY